MGLTIPRAEIRARRRKLGLTQEGMADAMTKAREQELGLERAGLYPIFTFQHVGRVEKGRYAVRFDDPEEPLWWALVVLGMTVADLEEP